VHASPASYIVCSAKSGSRTIVYDNQVPELSRAELLAALERVGVYTTDARAGPAISDDDHNNNSSNDDDDDSRDDRIADHPSGNSPPIHATPPNTRETQWIHFEGRNEHVTANVIQSVRRYRDASARASPPAHARLAHIANRTVAVMATPTPSGSDSDEEMDTLADQRVSERRPTQHDGFPISSHHRHHHHHRPSSSSHICISLECEKPARRKYLEQAAYHADVVFFSREWAHDQGFTSPCAFLQAQRAILRDNAIAFCTWGAYGACVYDVARAEIHLGHPDRTKLVGDSVGAGDSFIAAAIHALAAGRSPAEVVQYACHIAGQKCRHGGFDGLIAHVEPSAARA